MTLVSDGISTDLSRDAGRDPMLAMYDQFIESCTTGEPSSGSWVAAIQVQRVIEAGYLSVSRGGEPVNLDELAVDPTQGGGRNV